MANGTWEDTAGLGVENHYGPRGRGDDSGIIKTEGSTNEIVIYLTGTNVSNQELDRATGALPAGAYVNHAYLEVTEAFVLAGTTPVVEVGTQGSEATNGLSITEAQMENIGVVEFDTTDMAGTWAARLAARTVVDVAMSGSSPTSTSAGAAKLVFEFVNLT